MARMIVALAFVAAAAFGAQAQNAPSRPYVVIGCVSQENAKTFRIADPRRDPPAMYRLEGDPKQLSMLVGQTVEVTGPMTAGAAKQPPTLKVTSLTRISTTCSKTK
jgi:hypothetical protein